MIDTKPPSKRAEEGTDWQIGTEQFVDGPDSWNGNTREGWKLSLVEDIPHKDVYALSKYSWNTEQEDEIVDIGTVSVSSNITAESVNEVLEKNDVERLTDAQFKTLNTVYENVLDEILRNGILDKTFQISEYTIYDKFDDWVEYMTKKVTEINEKITRIKTEKENNEISPYMDPSTVEYYTSLETLSDTQMDALGHIPDAVQRPHEDGLQFAEYCQLVGTLTFESLEPFELRAIELIQNGLFNNSQSVAIVQALKEENLSQRQISEKLGKDESTISKQVKAADELTKRARWHSANVSLDGRM